MIRDFYALVRFAVRQKFRMGSFIPPEANGKDTFTLIPPPFFTVYHIDFFAKE